MAISDQELLGYNPESKDIDRKRKLAELLMARGMQQPQGQMISGRYVAPSFTQNLSSLFDAYQGNKIGEEQDQRQLALAEQLRKQEGQDLSKFYELQYGGKQIPAQAQAGPMPDGGNIPIGTTTSEPNPQAAFQMAAQSRSPMVRAQLAEMLKEKKVGEGETITRLNPMTGKIETVAKGAEKYRAPTSVDMGTMGTMLIYPDGRREVVQKGREGPAGQVVETENGPMLVNTRTGQAQPIMAGGQAIAGSPKLTETQSNATAFGMRAKEANKIVTALENKGITNTGIIRSAISGTVGMAPFVGGKMEQGVQSAMNVLPGAMGGPNEPQQQTDQGRRNFISAVLRKESGAAIPPDEYANEEKKYFPQVGDGPKVIKQKQEARELAIKALEIQAGPGAKQIRALGTDTGVVDFNSLPKRGQ